MLLVRLICQLVLATRRHSRPFRHSREGGNPEWPTNLLAIYPWIPASATLAKRESKACQVRGNDKLLGAAFVYLPPE